MSKSDYVIDETFDVNRIIYSEPKEEKIPDSKVSAKRIYLSYKNKDGTIGTLNIATDWIYSFGINVNLDEKNKDLVTGYTMPLCLFNKNGPSDGEKQFVDDFNAVVEKTKDHLLASKDDIDQYSLERSDLKKICNCLYYKRDPKNKAKILEGVGPTLYAKLLFSKKKNEIMTQFYDESDNIVNPSDITEKHCHARALIRFESIFVGNKISLQVKLYECEVRIIDNTRTRLLPRPVAVSQSSVVAKSQSFNPVNDDDDDDDAGSLKDEGKNDVIDLADKVDELTTAEEEEPPKVVAPVVKKKIVKVLKK
jgi:hypothetical protein